MGASMWGYETERDEEERGSEGRKRRSLFVVAVVVFGFVLGFVLVLRLFLFDGLLMRSKTTTGCG